jgi:hypothetical protein
VHVNETGKIPSLGGQVAAVKRAEHFNQVVLSRLLGLRQTSVRWAQLRKPNIAATYAMISKNLFKVIHVGYEYRLTSLFRPFIEMCRQDRR